MYSNGFIMHISQLSCFDKISPEGLVKVGLGDLVKILYPDWNLIFLTIWDIIMQAVRFKYSTIVSYIAFEHGKKYIL